MKRVFDGDADALEGLFLSERVDNTIGDDSIFLPSFNIDGVLPHSPFHSTIYVLVCPNCLRPDNFKHFKTLVERNAVIPTLSAPYATYDSEITNFLAAHDHISSYEYRAFRYVSVLGMAKGEGVLCRHCVGKWERSAKRYATRSEDLKINVNQVDRILSRTHPFIYPDFEILDEFKSALKAKDADRIARTIDIGEVVYGLRSAQAFSSSFVVDDFVISKIPKGLSDSLDAAVEVSDKIGRDIADGLGLHIPTTLPLEEYLEIASAYRPQIRSAIAQISSAGKGGEFGGYAEVNRQIMRINADIEKIRVSTRSQILNAVVEFYGQNSTLINASLVASAVGITGHLAGCGPIVGTSSAVVAAGGAAVRGVAKKKNWMPTGPAAERLAETIQTKVQPYLDRVIAAYLGVSQPAVTVMSVRRGIDHRVNRAFGAPPKEVQAKRAPQKSR